MEQVKSFDFQDALKNGITGKSGKVYKYSSELSSERYHKKEEWLIDLYYSTSIEDHINGLGKVWDDLNNMRLADAAQKVHRMRESVYNIASRSQTTIRLVMLHFNAEGEDAMGFDEAKIMEKVSDVSHLNYLSFFLLSLRLMNLSKENLDKIFQEYLKVLDPKKNGPGPSKKKEE